MTTASADPVILNVHLAGPIAFVPEGNTLWALIPNALVPTRTRWSHKAGFLSSRSSHMALMIIDDDIFDRYDSNRRSTVVYKQDNLDAVPGAPLYPFTPGAKTAIRLFNEELDFGLQGGALTQGKEIEYVPQMEVISSRHCYVAKQFHPKDPNFDSGALSTAFHMNSGHLEVKSFFGSSDPDDPTLVDFGYVSWDSVNPFPGKVWGKRVANHLIWRIEYPAELQEVVVKTKEWNPGAEQQDIALRVPPSKTIDIAIIHSEPELPFLFLTDPALPKNVSRFPDPDFEMFYALSDNQSPKLRWRVPIHSSGNAGGDEKTCSNGYFKGFK